MLLSFRHTVRAHVLVSIVLGLLFVPLNVGLADMNGSLDVDAQPTTAASADDLTRLKSEAELEKLRLEAEELRDRIEKAKKWYTGRYLAEALIGGVVAGALFVSWFVGFYSPRIAVEKERREFAQEREKEQYDRELERQQYEKETFLRQHVQFSELVTDGNRQVRTWLEGLTNRMQAQTEAFQEREADNDPQVKALLTYLEKETGKLDEIIALLALEVSSGNELARQFRDSLDRLGNADFFVTIVYDSEFKELAYKTRDALLKHEYKVKVESWTWFKEDGDPSMSSFFGEGPVLWYQKDDQKTNDEIESIRGALTEVFPDNMTLQRGDTVVVPGITWSPPPPLEIQLWLFQQR